MQLAKYSKYKDKVYTTVASSETSSSSTSSSSSDRNLWGNDDSGNDMNGSMRIQGNIYIMGETFTEDDEGERIPTSRSGEASSRAGDDPFPPSADDGEGNLYLDGKVYSDGVETKGDIVSGGHIYINHPHPDHQGEKKCVGELINALDGRITTNTTNITNLTTKVNTNATNIQTNADDIAKLQTSALTKEDVLKLIAENQPSMDGDVYHPIVLVSGVARRVSYYKDKYYIGDMRCNPHISLSNTIEGGLMTIDIQAEDGYTVRANAVHATQQMSGDTGSDIVATVNGRNDGAHWFECRVDSVYNTTKAYIREFHQKDGNNDSWGADTWFGDGGVSAVNITIIGYVLPTP